MALKRYRVVAEETNVLGHATGDEFEFDFAEGYDLAGLLASGAVAEISEQAEEAKPHEPTKQELLDRTAELGISSSSSMSKADLKAAIEQHHMQEVTA